MYKRPFDIFFSIVLIITLGLLMLLLLVLAAIDTQSTGVFKQKRVGQHANLFYIYKLRTFHKNTSNISKIGAFLRKFKLDELPQLFNVLKGEMSLVGPRPDVEGYYDRLKGKDRLVLNLKPGITGLASLKYKNEEFLLSQQDNPIEFNDTVIFPDKIRLNLIYLHKKSLKLDILILMETILPLGWIKIE
jgi:lipopolysaccharide/colanic/teichoic acid biosynthesis glycosyltransferase